MGIERFFSSIEENKIANLYSKFSKTHKNRLRATKFYIDFNSIIHVTSKKVQDELNKIFYRLITNNKDKTYTKLVAYYELNIDNINWNDFKILMTDDYVSKIIIDEVIKATYKLLEFFLESGHLEFLYISIDGVPNRSKMEEQKKRRYMGYVISGIRKKIFEKHEDKILEEKNRYIFETNRISWSKNNITPGTFFMKDMEEALNTVEFELKIKDICKNLKKYVYSGTKEYGEGEKKIVDIILSDTTMKKSNYVIYSPDSDVTLLALLLSNNKKITKLKILRHNQQKNNYDIIDIDTLSENIYQYILKNLKIGKVPNKSNVIDDIVFILTVFGNDFVPKIESINVKYDFDKIINIYTNLLAKFKLKYLIDDSKSSKKKVFDQIFFIELINELRNNEGGNLQNNYMSNHYRNYQKLKKILESDSDTFNKKLNDFLQNLRKLNTMVRNKSYDKINDIDRDFFNTLRFLVRFKDVDTRKITIKELIDYYINFYNSNGKFPWVQITFQPYSHTIEDNYHQTKIESSLDFLDPKLKILDFDREVYKLDNMLDEYKTKLNSKPLELGKVYINTRSYTFEAQKILDSVKKYYEEHFNISDIQSPKMDQIVQDYILGLMWVFDYYYNSFDTTFYSKKSSDWYYKHERAPLLTQICNYFKKNKSNRELLTNYTKKVEQSYIYNSEYFNCVEQLMYVSPAKNIKWIMPTEFHSFIDKTDYFSDLDVYVNKIWKNPTNNIIDCVGVLFLNKCFLNLDNISSNDYKLFLSEIRKIELTTDTKLRACIGSYSSKNNVYNYRPVTSLNKVKREIIEENTFEKQYEYYKKRYLHTRNKKYKTIYKRLKKLK